VSSEGGKGEGRDRWRSIPALHFVESKEKKEKKEREREDRA